MAWESLGWEPLWFSEIEPFPSAVLRYRWPSVPNMGNMTRYRSWGDEAKEIDLLVGGTPCQSFSVAGLRRGLDDPRGNLALVYLGIAEAFRPRWLVWENVAGVLSSGGGRDFGSLLGALGELGYGFAYRVLDAQYFGVPQQRRRVFLVGRAGDWRPAAAVLFEREGMQGTSAEDRQARRARPGLFARGPGGAGVRGTKDAQTARRRSHRIVGTLTASCPGTFQQLVGEGQCITYLDVPKTVGALITSDAPGDSERIRKLSAIYAAESGGDAVCGMDLYNQSLRDGYSPTLTTSNNVTVSDPARRLRRLTPMEAERLQGFPDDHTRIPWVGGDAGRYIDPADADESEVSAALEGCSDGPRMRVMGNSMAVPVMRWIGRRIAEVDGAG